MRVENSVWSQLVKDTDLDDKTSSFSITYVMNTPTGIVIRVVATLRKTESMVFAPNVEAYTDDNGLIDLRMIGGAR